MLLFHNRPIHTMDPAQPTVEAVLVGDDGRIQAVGAFAGSCYVGGRTSSTGRHARANALCVHHGGAILSVDETNRGSITPGKWADLVVLNGAPLATPPAQLRHSAVADLRGWVLRYQAEQEMVG